MFDLRFAATCVAALSAAPLAVAQTATPGTEPPPILHAIPADAVGGVTLDVERLRGEPVFARTVAPLLGEGGPFAVALGELGLAFEDVRAVAAFVPPADPEEPYPSRDPVGEPLFLVRVNGPVVVPEALAERGVAKVLPDGRTLALAIGRRGGETLAALGAPQAPAAGSAAALAEELAHAAPAGLLAFGDVTAVRSALLTELDFAVRREDEWIPAFGFAHPAITSADALALAVELREGVLAVRLVAAAPDAASADRLRRTAEAAVIVAGNVLNGLPGAMLRREPEQAALVALAANALRRTLASVAVTGEGPVDAPPRAAVAATVDAETTAAAAALLIAALREEFGPRPAGRSPRVREIGAPEARDASEKSAEPGDR
ncbi:hypothetical protein [Alienimonas californiensis]|uniref:Uncharacterized protein n=1 Tax=Alienimonas californiensis TaxID=2527989 RepID=A0A517P6W6_9PLAN|nr:hypothetical protein [Alienimonas californiensis]QDT15111.1 hypothetical protein CA12_11920 [Alienimonas californiensis]